MKLTPAQALHIQLTAETSALAYMLSTLDAEEMQNPTDEVLLATDRLEDAMLDFLRLTGRLDVVLENHVEELIADSVLCE
jgi:hypothetical protein